MISTSGPWAASVAGPIFEGGRLKSAYQAQQAYWDETIAQYKQTITVAFRETSDALIAQQTLVDQRAALQSQVEALKESVDLSIARYNAGRASYFEVLEAQQQLFPSESALGPNATRSAARGGQSVQGARRRVEPQRQRVGAAALGCMNERQGAKRYTGQRPG